MSGVLDKKPTANGADMDAKHPAHELSLHLLRMLETRLEAAGIVLQTESRRVVAKVQLQLLAAACLLIGLWGGIVFLAIALPPHLRVPVLGGVVGAFVVAALVAFFKARSMTADTGLGSLEWFLASLKQDLEIWARSLAFHQAHQAHQAQQEHEPEPGPQEPVPPPDQNRSPPSDIAA
jgi:uncharacterized membrane protein YqjE